LLAKGASPEEALQALAKGLTQKMLHGAMTELQVSDPELQAQSQQTIERLFLRGADRQR
jgi:glutamyl-tRNA reductase